MMNNSDKALIILAGGESTRFGKIGDVVPKFLLPFNNTSLLQKQVHYAIEAGVRKIIISTLPEFASIIENFFPEQSAEVKIFSNPRHSISSFSGLAQVIREMEFKSAIAVSFSDIYFIRNPFTADMPTQTSLYLSQPCVESELEQGGDAFLEDNFIEKILKKPLSNNKQGLRWNGLWIISSQDQEVLIKYVEDKTADFPGEDFFNYLLTKRKKLLYRPGVDFINNNSQQDLFLSSLYDFAENFNSLEKDKILDVARIIRKNTYIK